MKQRELIKKIKSYGYYFSHHGHDHDFYTNGKRYEPIPRHREIKESTAKLIIKHCKES